MMKIQRKMEALPAKPRYAESKPFFSPKEIIFRGEKRAMVFNISPKLQVIFLCLFLLVGGGSAYSYHMYHRSDRIITKKEQQLGQTREAYVELMTEFAALNKNVGTILDALSQNPGTDAQKAGKYKRQAEMIAGKIDKITSENDWLSQDVVTERASLYEALLQRDIIASERDELKEKLENLGRQFSEMREVELEVFDKINSMSSREVDKMKRALNEVNKALKEKGLYFNSLSNKQRSSGGPYIPDNSVLSNDKQLNDKVSAIFQSMEDLDYYRQVVERTPIGKPVWSYWVSSKFGSRLDPFRKSKATHKGIDLASMTGNKIRIKAKGKVTRAEVVSGYGKMVEVDHGNGFKTKYAHMNEIYVTKGEEVVKDQPIGEVGSTGRSTGPHLHYEILYRGVPVDPMPFMQAKI